MKIIFKYSLYIFSFLSSPSALTDIKKKPINNFVIIESIVSYLNVILAFFRDNVYLFAV